MVVEESNQKIMFFGDELDGQIRIMTSVDIVGCIGFKIFFDMGLDGG